MANTRAYDALKQEIEQYVEVRHIPAYLAAKLFHDLNEAETLARIHDDLGIAATDPMLESLYGTPTL